MITLAEFHTKYSRLPTEKDPDWQKEITMSKFQLLDIPIMAPGRCSNCGAVKPDGRKYVDFGLTLDHYGVVYICSLCLFEAAGLLEKALGLNPPVAEPAINRHEILVSYIEQLEKSVIEMIDLVKGYASTDIVVSDSGTIPGGKRDTDISIDPEAKSDDKPADEDESGTTKQTTKSRRSDVPSLAELLKHGTS